MEYQKDGEKNWSDKNHKAPELILCWGMGNSVGSIQIQKETWKYLSSVKDRIPNPVFLN